MVRLPKIKIGVNKKKSYKDFSHDVETTSDFGFCQPTIVSHVNAGSSSTLKTGIAVRLAPLPCPTFGRIKLKTYNALVPIREVYEAFPYMQKNTSVASAFGSYVPKEAPYINSYDLFRFIVFQSLKENAKLFNASNRAIPGAESNAFLNFTFAMPKLDMSNIKQKTDPITGELIAGQYEFIDYTFVPMGRNSGNGIEETEIGSLSVSVGSPLYRAIVNKWISNDEIFGTTIDDAFFDLSNSSTILEFAFSGTEMFEVSPLGGRLYFGRFVEEFYGSGTDIPLSVFTGRFDNEFDPVKRSFYFNRGAEKYDMLLSYGSFDVSFTYEDVTYNITVPMQFTANWTKRGQRLFKVLNAIGLRGFVYNDPVDLPKFFAYYKAWFDIMNPGRTQQWKETCCYKLIHSYYDLNIHLQEMMFADIQGPRSQFYPNVDVQRDFEDFLVSVSDCCFVLPLDNFTAATPSPLLQRNVIESKEMNLGNDNTEELGLQDAQNNYPFAQNVSNGLVIKGLLQLYYLANKNSVIGSRIEDYLRTKFGYTIPKSNILQGSEQTIKIEEIFANAGTSENVLGEIGGRGSNNNVGQGTIKFDVDEHSIFVQFIAIVPWGDYVQGNVKAKITKNDWLQDEYDSLGKEALSMSEIMSRSSDFTYSRSPETFGFVPMYWRDKYRTSMHSGAFALPSQRDTIIPYSLDRLFNEHEKVFKLDSNGNFSWKDVPGSSIAPSEELRFVGKTPDYGSYDRIFFDNTGYFDNFILHIIEDWAYYDSSKPVAQSFDTVDDELDDSVTTVSGS